MHQKKIKVAETYEPPGFVIGVQDDERTTVSIKPRFSSKTTRIQTIRMARQDLERIKEDKLIRRIDGNQRPALAEQLQDNPTVPTKFIAPFCLILLGDAGNEADDYVESLIFHTINNRRAAFCR